ncbi:MAG: ROK family protein, partial [Bacteroidales bacterium]|nr:ROK family protein [Bacteroidales bacterium]
MVEQFVVGVDVGGQTSKIGVVNAAGEILSQSVIRSDVYGSDADAFLSALADAIKANIDDSGKEGQIKGVGVGAPNVNYYTGTVSYAPNLAWAADKEVKFAEELSAKLGGIPVTLTNDANAAAVGEMTYGVAQNLKHFIMITLGTGVGSGIIVNGQLLYGHDGFAGELGHTKVQENGRLCGCGGRGCLEAYCSATGVARTAREILDTTEEPSLLRKLDNITSKDVYDAAKEGDAVAMKIFDFTARLLGKSLANFVSFSSPQAIVLFGGLARAKEFLYEPMMEA